MTPPDDSDIDFLLTWLSILSGLVLVALLSGVHP